MKVVVFLTLLFAAVVASKESYQKYKSYTEEKYEEEDDQKEVPDEEETDFMKGISKYHSFKCPAGQQYMQVLACLPCDYGFFKDSESFGFCKPCPDGQTTLTKGAKECVKFCPPGYERSRCGRTCTKCRPGYFKSTDSNERCRRCPKIYNCTFKEWGLISKDQCYKNTTKSTAPPGQENATRSTAAPGQESTTRSTPAPMKGCNGTCTPQTHYKEHPNDCRKFCQCTPLTTTGNGQTKHHWVERPCAKGTGYSSKLKVCVHLGQSDCADSPPEE